MGSIREFRKKDGGITYHAEVRMKGHLPQRATFRTKSLAKKWVQDVESGIRDGRHFRTVESKRHTVGEMIDRFVTQWLPKYPKREAKQTALLSWWKQRYGHVLLSDFSSVTIAEGRDALLNEPTVRGKIRSSSTVNRYLSALGKALIVTVKEYGWLEDSPMRKVSKPPEGKGRDRFLSLDEKNRLIEECKKSRNKNLYPIVALALITGMRQGEILNLRWQDVDLGRKTLTLHQTKNGDTRYIPLTSEAEYIIKNCASYGTCSQELIFQSSHHFGTERKVSIRDSFEAALKRSNIHNFRFHDLRHTAASYMAMAGATQGELMAILGHRTPHMTRRYAHYSQDHLQKVLEQTAILQDKP